MSMNSWTKKLRGGDVNDNKDSNNNDNKEDTNSNNDNNNSNPNPSTPASTPQNITPEMTAEELRRKRLERFGGPGVSSPASPPAATTSPTPSPTTTTTTTPSTTTATTTTTTTTTTTSPQSTSPVQSKPVEIAPKTQTIPISIKSPLATSPGTRSNLGVSSSPPRLSPSPGGGSLHSFEQWENQIIERIFQVSLAQPRDSSVYLKVLRTELEEDGEVGQEVPLLSTSLLERVIFERLSVGSTAHRKNHILYLIGCFKRAVEEQDKATTKKAPEKARSMERIVEFIIDYSSLVLLYPEDWPSTVKTGFQEEAAAQFLACLEADPESSSFVPQEFLDLLIKRLDEGQVAQLFTPVFDELSYKMKAVSLLGSFVPLFRVFALLTKFKPISNLLQSLPNWVPSHNLSGREIETNSFLGPFFRLTSCPIDQTVANHYFAAPSAMSNSNVTVAHSAIRTALLTSQRLCHETVKAMLSAGGKAKEAVLDWIAAVLKHNIARTMMQADRRKTSSDAFMMNLSAVMLQLCVPFLDPSSPKVNMIDPTYFLAGSRLGLLEDTKLAATSEDVRQFLSMRKSDDKPPGFITECFFLTLRCLHLGLLPVFEEYAAIVKAFVNDRNMYDAFSATRDEWPENQVAANENLLARLRQRMDDVDRDRLCYQAQLLEPTLLDTSMNFYLLTAVWLSRLADPEKKGLPLEPAAMPLATLPEHCVEDIVEYFVFITRYLPEKLEGKAGLDDLITFLVLFLGSPTHVKNPYLRAKLVELMHSLTPKVVGRNLGLFENNVIAQRHLARVLMSFYVDIEFAERSHNFYEKFNTRYDVAAVMKHIWQIPEHRRAIEKESNDEKLFLRFVNMLINDSIYLLDESLNKLAEIRSLEVAMEDKDTWNQQDEETRQEREDHFKRLERQVGTYMLLGNETINMMHYLTADIAAPFLRAELVDRLASMLNYFLQQLAGPKCTNLKVTKPDKYHFKPKVLLGQIVDMYTHFGSKDKLSYPFAEAVARDDRSYNDELFPRVTHILRRESLKPEQNVQKFETFAEMVKEAAAKAKDSEESLGEIPDDYLDPIMATLMTDPVILPTSGKTMDRAVIARHLLSDNKDPFNRQFLTVEMLQPNEALKKEIEDWLASKRK